METLLKQLVGERTSGFVFLNESFANGRTKLAAQYQTDKAFRQVLAKLENDMQASNPAITKREIRRDITSFCRSMGQIPVKRLQAEFGKLTTQIGCAEFTRVHDLRHLFTTRAQERGAKGVQGRLGASASLGIQGIGLRARPSSASFSQMKVGPKSAQCSWPRLMIRSHRLSRSRWGVCCGAGGPARCHPRL